MEAQSPCFQSNSAEVLNATAYRVIRLLACASNEVN